MNHTCFTITEDLEQWRDNTQSTGYAVLEWLKASGLLNTPSLHQRQIKLKDRKLARQGLSYSDSSSQQLLRYSRMQYNMI